MFLALQASSYLDRSVTTMVLLSQVMSSWNWRRSWWVGTRGEAVDGGVEGALPSFSKATWSQNKKIMNKGFDANNLMSFICPFQHRWLKYAQQILFGERNDRLSLCKMHSLYYSLCYSELEKLGQTHRVALRIAKDPRFDRLSCTHKGTYADDCIVDRVTQVLCYCNAANGQTGHEGATI